MIHIVTEDESPDIEPPPYIDHPRFGHVADRQLAQIADLLGIPVSRITEDVPEEPDDLLGQSLLMNRLFMQIQNSAARSRVIAIVRDVLHEEIHRR